MDNFGRDPLGGHAMLQTAENVAASIRSPPHEQHDVVLMREQQYRDALADGCALSEALHEPAVRGAGPRVQKDGRDARIR